MATWLIPFSDLTPEQQRAIQFTPDRHRVIFGAPGSGKTQILLHRASHLSREFNVAPDRFRIFVFNNVLKTYIQSALRLLNLPDDSIITYDHWCNLYYTSKINKKVPWSKTSIGPDYEAIRQAVFEHARSSSSGTPEYDFVLVDEGQDLDAVSFETLKLISRHVTVCMDNNQRIYEAGAGEADVMRQLGLSKRNMSLLGAYRCCPYVIRLAAQFIDDAGERDQYMNQAKTDQTERQTPLLYYASGFEDSKRRMIEVIKTRQAKGDKIGIFFYTNKQVYGYAQGLREAGLEVEVQKAQNGSSYRPLDFTSERPKVLTYHSAKGLTFDSVIMPQLVEKSFAGRRSMTIERLMFVGISRATKWVYMSSYEDTHFSLLDKILPLSKQGYLTVQHAGEKIDNQEEKVNNQKLDDLTDIL